ncbi:MAG TPA: PKD domain-containing protein [Methanoregulaceae archaeon]|nr:PKD domain-containing protein [Methanoregulaceae archaeon]
MKTPILLFLIALLVTSASGSVLSVGNGRVNATSELASMNITLDSAPDGLMDYNLSVTIDDPSIATIKNVEFPPWAITTETSLLPSSFCWLNATTGPGTNITTETTLVTITLEGLSGGTTPVSLAVYSMRDDYSNEINPSIINGTFTVNAPVLPYADFSANTTSGIAPLTVAFTDESSGTAPLTYAWDFEDNGTVDAITQNATHTYLAAGNYTVNLTVTGPGGIDSEVRTDYITVTEPPAAPVAAFSANTTSGTAPLTVAFTDESSGTAPLTYAWDFEDNGTVDAITQNATHTYLAAGNYTVNLTVTGPGGIDSEVRTDYITVTEPPAAPVADFSANTTTGVAPLTVAFTDESSGTAPLTYAWDLNNNGVIDSSSPNPVALYSSAGSYTVNLTVTNDIGSDSEIKIGYITVTEPPAAPVAAFSANTTSGIAPLTVAFADASTGAGTKTYEWDFTNDGTVDATTPDAVYTYSSAGTYTVNLTVTNAGGSDSEVKTDYITVTTAPVSPTAAFSASTTSGTAPLTVAFTDESSGTAPLTYAWDFEDNGTVDATTKNATHTYLTAGNYTVNLTVTGPGGTDSEVKSSYITVTSVTPKISAQFTASPVSGRSPLAVRFTDQSIGTITSYEWDFNNDGMVDSRMKNPLKFFTSAGEYTVQLTVRGPDGTDQEVQNQYIDVTAKPLRPIAFFSANTLSGAAPLNVTFTDKSYNNPDSYLWKFGDGTTSTLKNPSHTYPVPGYYKVGLTASNAAGSSSMAMNIYVSSS